MEIFQNTLGFVAAVCAGIVFLAAVFSAPKLFRKNAHSCQIRSVNGLIQDGKWINVHTSSGKVIERVRFLGFTDSVSPKTLFIPYQLNNTLVLERETGERILLRADTVRMLEELVYPKL